MKQETFEIQIARLRTEWPHSYGEARSVALWALYRSVPDDVFRNAVTDLLLDHRGGAPVRQDFEKAVERARLTFKRQEWLGADSQASPPPGTETERIDPAKVKALLKTLFNRLDGIRNQGASERDEAEHRDKLRSELRALSAKDRAAGEK